MVLLLLTGLKGDELMTDNTDRPVVPDGWVEFDYSDPDADAVKEYTW